MAHLKLKNWSHAESDATSALQIDPTHFKSYQRRCVARLSLGKLRAAMVDVCAAEESCLLAMENFDKSNKETSGSSDASSILVTKSSLDEIYQLKTKIEAAMQDAVKRAPRRRIPVVVI